MSIAAVQFTQATDEARGMPVNEATIVSSASRPSAARWPLLIGGVVILCGISGLAGYRARHPLPKSVESGTYVRVRKEIVANEAMHEPRGETLFIGDSIVERSGIHRLCGNDVFNAGISWAKLGDVEDLAPKLAQAIKPRAVYVQIGTNDARRLAIRSVDEWRDHYLAMVRSFGMVPVVLVPAPELEAGKTGTRGFDPARLTALDATLPAIAGATGARLLPRPAVRTDDGVHPSPEGAAAWRARMEEGCTA